MTLYFGLLFSLNLLVVSPCAADDKWVEHTNKNVGFTVAFPKAPIDLGTVVFFQEESPPYRFQVNFGPLSKKLENRAEQRAFLEGGQKGTVDRAKGKRVRGDEVDVDGRLSRTFSFHSEKYGFVRCHLHLSDTHFVHLSFFSKTEKELTLADANKFFDSFKFAK